MYAYNICIMKRELPLNCSTSLASLVTHLSSYKACPSTQAIQYNKNVTWMKYSLFILVSLFSFSLSCCKVVKKNKIRLFFQELTVPDSIHKTQQTCHIEVKMVLQKESVLVVFKQRFKHEQYESKLLFFVCCIRFVF